MTGSGRTILVTGSAGLVGSEMCLHFHGLGFAVEGVDSHRRAEFFGPEGDTRGRTRTMVEELPRFRHHEMDVRERARLTALVKKLRPAAIVHAAAQPSHDRSAVIPVDDFDINAGGTLNLLEAARLHCPESPFVFLSTNKVYGDRPNLIPLRETTTRWEYADPAFAEGIPEELSIDQSLHTPFGASKAAADLLVQEYARSYGLPACCLRGGCITGPGHAGVKLHGFLNYLVRCAVEGRPYTIIGHKGKQVRDNLHSLDVALFAAGFIEAPRKGEVYNLGGGKGNSCSVLEAISLVEGVTGRKLSTTYDDRGRVGDHVCYYSDLRKSRLHYPGWSVTRPLPAMVAEMVRALGGKE